METLREWVARLWSTLRPRRHDAELEEELRLHLEMAAEHEERHAGSPDAARRAALIQAGGVGQAMDALRDQRGLPWLEDLHQDVRYALRTFRRAPTFTAVVVLTLALGIGANAAMFTVMHAVVLSPLPYHEAHRLVRMSETIPAAATADGRPRQSGRITRDELLELRARARSLSHVSFTSGPAIVTVSGHGEAARLQGMRVAPRIFDTLGVAPLVGRTFGDSEEVPGAEGVMVLSYRAWQDQFDGDAAILGRTLTLTNVLTRDPHASSKQYEVVGVMPPGFEFVDGQMQFWIPVEWTASTGGSVIARLAEGGSHEAAAAEIGTLLRELREAPPLARYDVRPWQEGIVEPVRLALTVLTVAVGVLLLIACINVVNLLSARTAARTREIAVRLALGGSRRRVMRQLLTESLILALAGGVVGVVLAFGGVRLFTRLSSTLHRMDLGVQLAFPRLSEITIDLTVVAYVLALSIVSGLLCGVVPAIRHSRPNATESLRVGTAAASGFSLARPGRGGAVLVVTEIALAMLLLVCGGLLMHSLVKLAHLHPGYDPLNVLTFQVAMPVERYPIARLRTFADDLVTRLQTLPGIDAAAYGQLPLVALTETAWFRRQPDIPKQATADRAEIRLVSRDYLTVMGIRVVAGRGFSDQDRAAGPRAVLINEVLARRELAGEDPIGQHVFVGPDDVPWEIAGIVEDVRQSGPDRDPSPQVFALVEQWPEEAVFPLGPYFSVRLHERAPATISQVREAVRQLDPEAGLFNIASMEQIVSNRMARPRLYAVLLGIFATLAGLLAASGTYGVMACTVERPWAA